MTQIVIGTGPLTRAEVVAVARHGAGIRLSADALAAIAGSRAQVDALAAVAEGVYGVSTGFGALATRGIPASERARLQRSLIRSHAAGNGPLVEDEVVRGLMLLRIATLAKGYSGVRTETVEAYAALLNSGLVPVVYEYGSLGCSGDLAPLAHCALALMGEGEVWDAGRRRPAAEALPDHGLEPIELAEKEGLALINGTDGMLAQLVLALADLEMLLDVADLAAALSVEGQLGTDRTFAADLMALRPQVGQATSAANLRRLLDGSPIVASHRVGDGVVQDAYSLRCSPQVHGSVRDTVDFAATIAERELASAIDNPSVLPDGRVESHGNFHGAPIAHVLDFLAIGIADLANLSERRTDRFLDANRSRGLPPFLADDPGIDSGLMIAQYTQAGICSKLKQLATPASVDSIPSSALQEDHVSMGWNAARKLRQSVDGLARVLAIEILTAARGIDLRAPLRPGPATGAAIAVLRETVPGPGPDRFLAPEIEAAYQLVRSGELAAATQDAAPEPESVDGVRNRPQLRPGDSAPERPTLRPRNRAQSQAFGRKVEAEEDKVEAEEGRENV
jgi:histidine ammonia-lyase